MAKIENPRKNFNFQITFVKHPLNPYLVQAVTLPEVSIEATMHGDTNHDIKTAGRAMVGTMIMEKISTTSGSDTWLFDWLMSCQDMALGGGLIPTQYKETIKVDELAEDGVSILNSHTYFGCWPMRINGIELRRMSSDNTIETIEFSVDRPEKI